jgi:hypothetical protein
VEESFREQGSIGRPMLFTLRRTPYGKVVKEELRKRLS